MHKEHEVFKKIAMRVASVKEHPELEVLDFLMRRWRMDKTDKLVPKIKAANDYAEGLETRWKEIMEDFDRFFKREQLVPREAELYYFLDDGVIYAAPKHADTPAKIVRKF